MYIYAVKITEPNISSILNFIKYLCAPNSKTEVHLSLRGPYKKKLTTEAIQEYTEIIKGSLIEVYDTGNFFSTKQNTVFYRCKGNQIRKVWYKKNYGYNPHLTIYDGKDKDFAEELYKLLTKVNLNFTFTASELILYDSSKILGSMHLQSSIDKSIITKIIGQDWPELEVFEMPIASRLRLISRCLNAIKE